MIRRFRPLREREIAAVETRLQGALAAWTPQWLRDPRVRLVAVVPAPRTLDETAGRWLAIETRTGFAHAHLGAAAQRELAEMLVHPEPLGSAESGFALVRDLVDAALAALVGSVLAESGPASLQVSERAPAADAFAPASGAAKVALVCGDDDIALLFNREQVDAITGSLPGPVKRMARRPLAARSRALGGNRVPLEVVLSETGLTLAELRRLRTGDVVMFDHRIERPVPVRVRDGGVVGPCFLGRRADRKAIRIVRNEDAKQ